LSLNEFKRFQKEIEQNRDFKKSIEKFKKSLKTENRHEIARLLNEKIIPFAISKGFNITCEDYINALLCLNDVELKQIFGGVNFRKVPLFGLLAALTTTSFIPDRTNINLKAYAQKDFPIGKESDLKVSEKNIKILCLIQKAIEEKQGKRGEKIEKIKSEGSNTSFVNRERDQNRRKTYNDDIVFIKNIVDDILNKYGKNFDVEKIKNDVLKVNKIDESSLEIQRIKKMASNIRNKLNKTEISDLKIEDFSGLLRSDSVREFWDEYKKIFSEMQKNLENTEIQRETTTNFKDIFYNEDKIIIVKDYHKDKREVNKGEDEFVDMSSIELFESGSPKLEDLNQDFTGDCYFESAIASILHRYEKNFFQTIMRDNKEKNTVDVKINGTIFRVLKTVPYNMKGKSKLWFLMLQKAYTAFLIYSKKSYLNSVLFSSSIIEMTLGGGGSSPEVLTNLLPDINDETKIDQLTGENFNKLKRMHNENFIFVSKHAEGKSDDFTTEDGIYYSHSYPILGFENYEIKDEKGRNYEFIKLRNPHGSTGLVSATFLNKTTGKPELHGFIRLPNGVFFMDAQSFFKNFNTFKYVSAKKTNDYKKKLTNAKLFNTEEDLANYIKDIYNEKNILSFLTGKQYILYNCLENFIKFKINKSIYDINSNNLYIQDVVRDFACFLSKKVIFEKFNVNITEESFKNLGFKIKYGEDKKFLKEIVDDYASQKKILLKSFLKKLAYLSTPLLCLTESSINIEQQPALFENLLLEYFKNDVFNIEDDEDYVENCEFFKEGFLGIDVSYLKDFIKLEGIKDSTSVKDFIIKFVDYLKTKKIFGDPETNFESYSLAYDELKDFSEMRRFNENSTVGNFIKEIQENSMNGKIYFSPES
jgi:hypothetical protein